MGNKYDNLELDIISKHQEINKSNLKSNLNNKRSLFNSYFDKCLYVLGLYKKLIDAGIYRSWFNEFNDYWTKALAGRPLNFHDFFFLYSQYRAKFQNIEVNDTKNNKFLEAWQKYENIYLIFGSVYKYALAPFFYYPFKGYLKRKSKILEYGCGMAPFISSMINDRKTDYDFYIADIPQFTYHYAKWRLKQYNVNFIDIKPDTPPVLKEKYDTIILSTVLEHLPNPYEVVSYLTRQLNTGGVIIFDYILGDGEGLDTIEAVQQREKILKYIEEEYMVLKGKIKYKESMGLTVIKKK